MASPPQGGPMAIAMRLRNQLQAVYKMDPLRNEARGRTGRAGGTGRRRWRRHRGPARAGMGGAAVAPLGGAVRPRGGAGGRGQGKGAWSMSGQALNRECPRTPQKNIF